MEKSPVRGLLTPCLSRTYIYILCQVTIYVLRQMKSPKVWSFELPWRIELWLSRKVTGCSFPPWLLITMTHLSHLYNYDYFLYTIAGEKAVKKFPLLPLSSLHWSPSFMYLIPHWFLKLDRCKPETSRRQFVMIQLITGTFFTRIIKRLDHVKGPTQKGDYCKMEAESVRLFI